MNYDKAEIILFNFGLEKKYGSYTKVEIAESLLKAYESGRRDASQPVNAADGKTCPNCGGEREGLYTWCPMKEYH